MYIPSASLLLVDDDAGVLFSLSLVLKAVGYRVRTAGGGFAALAEMRKDIPEILISDMNMPGMSGFELLSVVRPRFPAMRVIAMSGGFTDTDADMPEGMAADAYYRKGGNLSALLMALEGMTDANRLLLERNAKASPIWTSRLVDDAAGAGYVTLTCPECLRTFSYIPDAAGMVLPMEDCLHRMSRIPSAIVPQPDTAEVGPVRHSYSGYCLT